MGVKTFVIPIDKQFLADKVDAEMVAMEMGKLKQQGYRIISALFFPKYSAMFPAEAMTQLLTLQKDEQVVEVEISNTP